MQLAVLLGCAATAGLGGGNFSSSMANISFFYPERRKGLRARAQRRRRQPRRGGHAARRPARDHRRRVRRRREDAGPRGAPRERGPRVPFLAAHPFIATYLAGLGFVGALVGSLARPLGGLLADRVGGARVTLAVFLGTAAFTLLAIAGVRRHDFAWFFAAFMASSC
jgi:nitrate/nitrite transporter NarK